jgi:hypothetical protein
MIKYFIIKISSPAKPTDFDTINVISAQLADLSNGNSTPAGVGNLVNGQSQSKFADILGESGYVRQNNLDGSGSNYSAALRMSAGANVNGNADHSRVDLDMEPESPIALPNTANGNAGKSNVRESWENTSDDDSYLDDCYFRGSLEKGGQQRKSNENLKGSDMNSTNKVNRSASGNRTSTRWSAEHFTVGFDEDEENDGDESFYDLGLSKSSFATADSTGKRFAASAQKFGRKGDANNNANSMNTNGGSKSGGSNTSANANAKKPLTRPGARPVKAAPLRGRTGSGGRPGGPNSGMSKSVASGKLGSKIENNVTATATSLSKSATALGAGAGKKTGSGAFINTTTNVAKSLNIRHSHRHAPSPARFVYSSSDEDDFADALGRNAKKGATISGFAPAARTRSPAGDSNDYAGTRGRSHTGRQAAMRRRSVGSSSSENSLERLVRESDPTWRRR